MVAVNTKQQQNTVRAGTNSGQSATCIYIMTLALKCTHIYARVCYPNPRYTQMTQPLQLYFLSNFLCALHEDVFFQSKAGGFGLQKRKGGIVLLVRCDVVMS